MRLYVDYIDLADDFEFGGAERYESNGSIRECSGESKRRGKLADTTSTTRAHCANSFNTPYKYSSCYSFHVQYSLAAIFHE
jgi:hypothetical protein